MKMSEAEKRLRSEFISNAEIYDKKHGDWVIFRFKDEGTFLCMDTWSGAFYYKVGSGEYNYWTGFSGKTFYYFGCNESWQGSDPRYTLDNVFDFYFEKMLKE